MTDSLIRVERDTPWRAQVGCTVGIGLVLVLLGGGIAVPVAIHWEDGG